MEGGSKRERQEGGRTRDSERRREDTGEKSGNERGGMKSIATEDVLAGKKEQ